MNPPVNLDLWPFRQRDIIPLEYLECFRLEKDENGKFVACRDDEKWKKYFDYVRTTPYYEGKWEDYRRDNHESKKNKIY